MERVKSIDLARGFTVLFIPIVHSVMLYGNPSVHTSVFGNILAFIAEWPGAQVFMLLMGISFSLSSKKSLKTILLRSGWLLVAGYLLNVVKFVIPHWIGILPKEFLHDIGTNNWKSMLLIGDILHFAAIALFVLYILNKLPEYPAITIIIAFGVCFLSPQVWDKASSNAVADHFLQLISNDPPETYFPLLPWLVYPLAGSVIGYYIKEAGNKTFMFLLPAGLGLMLASFCAGSFAVAQDDNFYRPGPWKTIMHLGFVCAWVSMWHFVSRIITDNLIFQFLRFLSKRITLIYLLQWPMVVWLIPVLGYHCLNIAASIVMAIDITLVVILITLIIAYFKSSKGKLNAR